MTTTISESLQTAVEHHQAGRLDESDRIYREILRIDPGNADAMHLSGLVAHQFGRDEEAISRISRAIELQPSCAEFHNNFAAAQTALGNLEQAAAGYRQAVKLKPDYSTAYNNLGIVLADLERFDEAMAAYQAAINVDPNFSEAYNNLGIVLKAIGRLDAAEVAYRRAIEIKPNYTEAHNFLGNVLREQGQLDESLESYERALSIDPNYAEAHRHRALLRLLQGDYRQGWEEYQWRWKCEDFEQPDFHLPVWDGSSLHGRSILIYAEQGVGDEIMFASCIPEIAAQAEKCLVECDPRLVPLFERSFPDVELVQRPFEDDAAAISRLSQVDLKIATGSMPRYLRTTVDSFPERQGYLKPDEQLLQKWQQRLAELGDGPKVGISWRGGVTPSVRMAKSTMLEQWSQVLSIPDICFVNLQYGDCANEFAEIRENWGVEIHDWDDVDSLNNLDDFAAQISALDLVISVSNATVHLAGAVGARVWTLLQHVPDSRWLLDRDDSPWYFGMKLFRQSRPRDWDDVFQNIAQELRSTITTFEE